MSMKKRGVLLCALGHVNYYRMAAVLAASIKVNEPDLSIHLVTNNTIAPGHEKLFDSVQCPEEKWYIHDGRPHYIKAKLFMYEMSPFAETIFLDADQIMIRRRKLLPVFNSLEDINFTMSNTGIAGGSIWADISEVKILYGNGKKVEFWNYHSEFVYFKKDKEVARYFKAAQKVYNDNKIISAHRFAGANMADELAFQAASIITGIYPHQKEWLPNFWFDRHKNMNRMEPWQLNDYITYSIGGKETPKAVKDNYNILAKSCFAQLGLPHPYQVVNKSSFLPERKII